MAAGLDGIIAAPHPTFRALGNEKNEKKKKKEEEEDSSKGNSSSSSFPPFFCLVCVFALNLEGLVDVCYGTLNRAAP